jgi:signal transduction histidine kinase
VARPPCRLNRGRSPRCREVDVPGSVGEQVSKNRGLARRAANLLDGVLTAVSFAVGALELALALLALRHLARFGRGFPWLAALVAFFLLRSVDRIYVAFVGGGNYRVELLLDSVLLVVVALLALGLEKTVRALRLAEDTAQHRGQEYVRALRDYRRLSRHRLANPLSAIRGSIAALRDLPSLDQETRLALLNAAEEQVGRLEQIALEPVPRSKEEATLRPRPTER